MSPTPSHGPGELAGQIAIVTGGDEGLVALSPRRSPPRERRWP